MWLLAGLGGVALRLCLWLAAIGSNDVFLWHDHALNVAMNGIAGAYRQSPEFNHPPLMGLYAAQALQWAYENIAVFARLLKLPGLMGEGLSLWALWRFGGPRCFAAYAWLPVAILISGFHGNTDCLYAAFLLVAAIAFDRKRFLLSGLLFAAALNVKMLPLVLLPLPLLGLRDRRSFGRFTAGLVLGLLPYLPPALTSAGAMYRNMIAYNSRQENWGVLIFLLHGARVPGLDRLMVPVRDWYVTFGRYVMLAAIVAVGLFARFRRKLPMTEQVALGAALFLLLTPGFGVQYLILPAPALCLVDLPMGLAWGWLSGLFLGFAYWIFLEPGPLMVTRFHDGLPAKVWMLGLAAWASLLVFVWRRMHRVAA